MQSFALYFSVASSETLLVGVCNTSRLHNRGNIPYCKNRSDCSATLFQSIDLNTVDWEPEQGQLPCRLLRADKGSALLNVSRSLSDPRSAFSHLVLDFTWPSCRQELWQLSGPDAAHLLPSGCFTLMEISSSVFSCL